MPWLTVGWSRSQWVSAVPVILKVFPGLMQAYFGGVCSPEQFHRASSAVTHLVCVVGAQFLSVHRHLQQIERGQLPLLGSKQGSQDSIALTMHWQVFHKPSWTISVE